MAMWTLAAVLLLSCFCGAAAAEDGGGPANAVSASGGDAKNCTNVTCENGLARLVMDKSVLERRKDCNHRLYNEEKDFVHSASASGVMDYWCLSKMYWKILCDEDNELRGLFQSCTQKEVWECGAVGKENKGVNNSSPGSTPESHVGSNDQLWLKILIPVASVLGVIGLIIVGWRMWRKRQGGSQPNITFSGVANEEPV